MGRKDYRFTWTGFAYITTVKRAGRTMKCNKVSLSDSLQNTHPKCMFNSYISCTIAKCRSVNGKAGGCCLLRGRGVCTDHIMMKRPSLLCVLAKCHCDSNMNTHLHSASLEADEGIQTLIV